MRILYGCCVTHSCNSVRLLLVFLDLLTCKLIKIHNPQQTRQMMTQLLDTQMTNIAEYDCFSQVVFESLEHYKSMKEDLFYRKHLFRDHENFADIERSV